MMKGGANDDDDVSDDDSTSDSPVFAVPAREMEETLLSSEEERAVVRVVRDCGPAVAFVTSILPTMDDDDIRRRPSSSSSAASQLLLQRGRSLGSGSGFGVDERGYLVTNFHVIEGAYQTQQVDAFLQQGYKHVLGNLTSLSGSEALANLVNSTVYDALFGGGTTSATSSSGTRPVLKEEEEETPTATAQQPIVNNNRFTGDDVDVFMSNDALLDDNDEEISTIIEISRVIEDMSEMALNVEKSLNEDVYTKQSLFDYCRNMKMKYKYKLKILGVSLS